MSSISNGLVVLAVARIATVDAFGIATLFFIVSAAAMGVGRGAFGTTIMLAAGRGQRNLRREAVFATVTALLFGLAVSCAVAGLSLLLQVPKLGAAFALAIPIVIVVDVFRYTLIADSRPHVAMIWDGVWAAGSALLFGITLFRPHAINDVTIIVLWGGFAAVSALGMAFNLRLRPESRGIAKWWQESFGSRMRYGLEAGLDQIPAMIITSVAAAVIGVAAAASIRGAATLLSPLAVLLTAIPLVTIPEAVRSGTPPNVLWRRLRRIGIGASLLGTSIGPALLLLPQWAGELILGETWNYARGVLPIVSFNYAVMVWIAVAMSFLRFQGRSRSLLAATATFAAISIIVCTIAAFLIGTAAGVAWGSAASAVAWAIVITLYARPARA